MRTFSKCLKMEKKKDQKIAPATSQEPNTNEPLSKEGQNQPNVAHAANKSTRDGSPLHADNAYSLNEQQNSVFQWPYAPQNTLEQPSSSLRPCAPIQSPQFIAVNQWHQLPHLQLNPTTHPIQPGHPLPHLHQPITPFLLPHHLGYHLPRPGVSAPAAMLQPFSPLGTLNPSWQVPPVIQSETSFEDHPQVPNSCYQVGYPYPGFSGPWDPPPLWGQARPDFAYTFPGPYGCFSSQPLKMSSCSAPPVQSSQRGIIRPPEKLSQKHQQLWEAQSAENVQLWNVIGQLQAEIADYKSRIMKVEARVPSLKQAVEEPSAHGIGTVVSGQPSRRRRPKRSAVSVDASSDQIQPRARGRKAAQSKVQTEAKTHLFEKVVLKKVENKENPRNPNAAKQQEDEKISNVITNNTGDTGVNKRNFVIPLFHNQVHQISRVGLNPSFEMKSNDDKIEDPNIAFAVLSQQAKVINDKGALATCLGAPNNGNLGWPSIISSEDSERNVLNVGSQGFYDNGSVIRQGRRIIPGWSIANEEDGSEDLDDAVVASTKDEDEEEMGDDSSAGGEEIPQTEGNGLPQFSNW